MNKNTNNILKRIPNCAAVILGAIGFFCGIAAAGTDDYRDKVHYANEQAGHEIYPENTIAAKSTTKKMATFSLISLLGASALSCINKKSR